MQLLTAEQVRDSKDRAEEEKRQRVKALNQEETDAVRRLNEARENFEKETKRIGDDLASFGQFADAKKKGLMKEIVALEGRRAEAMKPIKEVRAEVERTLSEAKTKVADADRRAAEIAARERVLAERTENLEDKEDEYAEREADLDRRKEGASAEESRLKKSEKTLSEKWGEYHAAAAALNAATEAQRREAEDSRKANEAVREENEKEKARIAESDRAVRDKYVALEQAKIHLGIK